MRFAISSRGFSQHQSTISTLQEHFIARFKIAIFHVFSTAPVNNFDVILRATIEFPDYY